MIITAAIFLPQCEKQETDPSVQITDPYFLQMLKLSGVDSNGDGAVSFEEAEAITSLTVNNSAIKELTGIEAFVNLDLAPLVRLSTLDGSGNMLTGLDTVIA